MTHIDCFSGPGGFCTGLHSAGWETRVAIEYIGSCCETYRLNHPEVHVVHDDIRNVHVDQFRDRVPRGGIDLVTSGMPCETFSTAGNTSRSFYDDRQFLFREGLRIATEANAKFILFENVPAITTKTVSKDSDELIVDVLKRELVNAGYANYIEVVLDASDFGVPQARRRYFVLATRLPNVRLSAPTPPRGARQVTVQEALAGLPDVVPNSGEEGRDYVGEMSAYAQLMRNARFWRRQPNAEITSHFPMKHRPCTMERFHLLGPGESLKDLFERYAGRERAQLQRRHVLPRKMFIKRNYRLPLDGVSPTVTSHCLDEFVHPVSDRALTVRECARLQSFPDSYQFCGPYLVPHIDRTVQDRYEQIGDAVPPLLARAWGQKVATLLRRV